MGREMGGRLKREGIYVYLWLTEVEMAWWHHQLNGHWIWVNSRSWWWTGRPGMLQFMGLQRVGYDWATELNWFVSKVYVFLCMVWTKVPVSFFLYVVSCPWTICWKDSSFPHWMVLELLLKSITHTCVCSFLDSQFCSDDGATSSLVHITLP